MCFSMFWQVRNYRTLIKLILNSDKSWPEHGLFSGNAAHGRFVTLRVEHISRRYDVLNRWILFDFNCFSL